MNTIGFFWLQNVMHPKNISSLPHDIFMDIQFTFENDILEKKNKIPFALLL